MHDAVSGVTWGAGPWVGTAFWCMRGGLAQFALPKSTLLPAFLLCICPFPLKMNSHLHASRKAFQACPCAATSIPTSFLLMTAAGKAGRREAVASLLWQHLVGLSCLLAVPAPCFFFFASVLQQWKTKEQTVTCDCSGEWLT